MLLDVILNNNFNPKSKHINTSEYVCGIIDVIRATTTMSVMIARGCKEIVIAENKTRALSYKKMFKDYLLCGEEGGLPPKGFDFGNSPLEYSKMDLEGRGIILKTTNGTKSFFKTLKSKNSFVVALVNISFVCDILVSEAEKNKCGILLVCSGEKNKIAFDDAYAAGMAVKKIMEKRKDIEITDGANIVLNNAIFEKNPLEALKKSTSYRSMIGVGLGADINICSMLDLYKVTGKLYEYSEEDAGNLISDKSFIKHFIKVPKIFAIKPIGY
ncbi:2-phosphosulfolactate phosphatase [bacterium]|nr:2-phosphosulfolactate phosphatase [bacterium]